MASNLVVGILATADPKAIEETLKSQNLDLSRVKVVTKADPSKAHDDSVLDFVHVAQAMESNSLADDMTKATGIMSDSGGTGVPGIAGSGPSLGDFGRSRGATRNYLGSLRIPSDEIDNFNEAVEAGRSVITYEGANGDVSAVASAFRAAGLRNVRTYEGG